MPAKTSIDEAEIHSLTIKTISEIVNQLVAAHERGEPINLTKLKT